ncbi:hypothetical protein MLD38_022844 [Melastoma candidum]|uniref:Uncharacterized protein n=1 Tax=Melastoma candidum TaxID=119954 RepID=A0ACB9QJY1_9MYRT|nr:hypothetical protein MLD38_022844 [Melastoma candidum]
MEHVPSQEPGDIPIPIPIPLSVPPLNTSYAHASAAAGGSHHTGHAHHPTIIPQHPLHNHLLIPHHSQLPPSTVLDDPSPPTQPTTAGGTPSSLPYKKPPVRYRECLKNHAASMGGNAMDGCGEFMPSGEEGTIEALNCSACGCHRNFHRKEVEGEPAMDYIGLASRMGSRKLILAPPHHHQNHHHQSPRNAIPGQIILHPHHQILQSDPDEQEKRTPGEGMRHQGQRPQQQQHHNSHQGQQRGEGKKRYRTKFTQEQKEKMLVFAERAGWKIQKQEESVVQRFCQEVGVKRRVLKVWMHNNKHNLASKASIGDQPGQGNGHSPPRPPSPPPPLPPPHMSHNSHPSMN